MTTNLINGKIYIGQKQSDKFVNSYYGSGKAICNAIKKYRKENFKTEIIYKANSIKRLNEAEIVYIEIYNSTNKKIGYNISLGGTAPMRGKHHTKKSKNKISEAVTGRPKSIEERHRLSASLMGHKVSNKTKEKQRQATLKSFTQERKEKLWASRRGVPITQEHKDSISKKLKGRTVSEETRKRMSESAKKVIHTPEWNKNIGLSNKGKIVTTKQRETMSKAQKGKHNNYVVSDSTKIKISNTLKRYYENKRKTESI
jgi:hypothetical protein